MFGKVYDTAGNDLYPFSSSIHTQHPKEKLGNFDFYIDWIDK